MKVILEIPLTIKEIAAAIGAVYEGSDRRIRGVTTDSREAERGDLFFALVGQHTNGECFVEDAAARGAVAVCVHAHADALLVADAEAALLSLAAFYRTRLPALRTVIAVTGSVGKTTTKEFSAAVLSQKYRVHATKDNYNNAIGVSLTVLSAPQRTEILIVEAGMNHLGELAPISEALRPDVAVITGIGTAHIGNLGSRAMIAEAKKEILRGMRGGTVLIPFGDTYLSDIEGALTVSAACAEADFFLMPIDTRLSGSHADLYFEDRRIPALFLPVGGAHHLTALAFALAAGACLGLSDAELRRGVSSITEDNTRQRVYKLANITILDDAYNASYESMRAAVEMLSLFPMRKKAALLGDMLELGTRTEELHTQLGSLLFFHGISPLFLFGVYAPFTARGAMLAGADTETILCNTDLCAPKITAEQILTHAGEDTLLLVKGSHGAHIDRVLAAMKEMTEENKNA